MKSALKTGRYLSEKLSPGLEDALVERYGTLLPEMPQDLVEFVYGHHYARPGLSLRDRCLATISALTALGGQTAPQLRLHIEGGLKAGLSKTEIAEAIWQMSLYGGFPASINALNIALEIFNKDDHL